MQLPFDEIDNDAGCLGMPALLVMFQPFGPWPKTTVFRATFSGVFPLSGHFSLCQRLSQARNEDSSKCKDDAKRMEISGPKVQYAKVCSAAELFSARGLNVHCHWPNWCESHERV